MARGAFWFSLILWAALYGASFAVFALVEPTGDGFTRGLNRIGYFLVLQTIAAAVAVVPFVLSRRFPRGAALRWVARAPIALALLLLVLILGLYVYGNTSRLNVPSSAPQPDRPTAAPAEPVPPPS